MVIALSLLGCDDTFPNIRPKLVDFRKSRTLVHDLVDKKNIRFKARGWEPISTLDGHYCLSSKDLQTVLNWSRKKISIEVIEE